MSHGVKDFQIFTLFASLESSPKSGPSRSVGIFTFGADLPFYGPKCVDPELLSIASLSMVKIAMENDTIGTL